MFSKATIRKEPVLRSAEPALRPEDPALWQGQPAIREILVTTTQAVEGRPVASYLGIVTGQALVPAGALRESPKRLRGLLRKAPADEDPLADSREAALRDLKSKAAGKGADAVLGVALGHQVLGDTLLVTATGTAVRLG